jgi:hypothetical protein
VTNTRNTMKHNWVLWSIVGFTAAPAISSAGCFQSNPAAQQQCEREQAQAQEREQAQAREQRAADERARDQQRINDERSRSRVDPPQYRAPEPAPQVSRPDYTPSRPNYTPSPAPSPYPNQQNQRPIPQQSGNGGRGPTTYTSPPATTYVPHVYTPGAANTADKRGPASPGSPGVTVYTPHSGTTAARPALASKSDTAGVAGPKGVVTYTPHVARVPVPDVPEAVRPRGPGEDFTKSAGRHGFDTDRSPEGVAGRDGAVVYTPRLARQLLPVVVPVNVVQVGTPVVVAGPAPIGSPSLAAALAQMQSAQAGCAQADAYQNYVNGAIAAQNTTDQGITQTLQTLAADTTDPNLQAALLSSIGQPNPINDALQQQMQNMASTYETICQTRTANAQAALSQSLGQPPPAPQGQPANSTANQTPTPASSPDTASPTATQANASADTPCPAASASNVPAPQAPWGAWSTLGNTGLVFDVSRVNDSTATWRFLNAGSNTISSVQFNYTYVDANTGQQATQQDVVPLPLAPGQSLGGWAAYTANTRGDIVISITQLTCRQSAIVQAQR